MAPDGELALTAGTVTGAQRYTASYQILPWLEGSIRYSQLHIYNVRDYFDRSFGLKMRLFEENEYFPEVSLGIRDVVGTGVYTSEYVVATKRWKDFDFSIGMGWGRLAGRATFENPFALVFPSFENRPPPSLAATGAGTVAVSQLFHGPKVGLFGGTIWRTPVDGLNVILEYSSDAYTQETQAADFKERFPINIGASYSPSDSIVASAGWLYGTSFGATITFSANATAALSPIRIGPDVPQPHIRSASEQSRALTALLANGAGLKQPTAADARWVVVPDTRSAGEHDLMSAILSEGVGVRGAEKQGETLLVDARLVRSSQSQCDRYASIVAGFDVPLKEIAVSDVDDPDGHVVICPILRSVGLDASTDSPAAATLAAPSNAPVSAATSERRIRNDVAVQLLRVEALSIEDGTVWLYYSNDAYRSESEAAGRIARILMADAPPDAEIFHVVSVKRGLAMRDFQINRTALERAATTYGTPNELGSSISSHPPMLVNPLLDLGLRDTYPRLHWALAPSLREEFFDPESPLQIQIYGAADATVDLTPRLSLIGRVEGNIYNNFLFQRHSDSLLPHVRSDSNEYYHFGSNGIAWLKLNYRMRVATDVYAEATAGYLESMFAGAGGQVLWRPEGERFAIGVDVYQVWQRNFDRLFGFRNYHVLTGHATFYYESPWHGLNFNVHVGRYLAGDYGATVEVLRRFDSGVEIGAFATITNVSSAKFGEGSFDKGIIIHIPFEWALPFYSQSSYDLTLRPLSRDGGQRLDSDDSLYSETRSTSYGEAIGDVDELVAP